MMIRAGQLDRLIEIQRASTTLNDAGTPTPTWTKLAVLRADVVRQGAAEYLSAAGAREETAIVFRTRWLDGVTTADRVLFEGKPYNLREIVPLGRRGGMELRGEAPG